MGSVLIILHMLSFAVAIGGGVANMIAAIQLKSAPPEALPHLGTVQKRVGRLSFLALILLWLTGGWMMDLAGGAATMPIVFWVKIAVVVVLTAASLLLQWHVFRAARAGGPPPAATMARLGQIAGLCAVLALVLAVVAFR
jgi:hypothetical protein